nr:septum formation initiator family protein [uncultured Blautia sp.]
MKRSKKRRSNQKIANNYLGMAAIAIVVLILLVGLTMQSNNLKARIAVYDAKAAALKQSIEDEHDRTKEIDEQKEYMQTDEYIAEVARDKLGLVKGNEIVFEEEK